MNVYFVYKVLTNRIRALIKAAGYLSSGLLAPFLHTESDQKLEPGKAWEQGYMHGAC